ncbi:MAG: TolC family protein [Deltaproteobacteria bacterium]|nr:TolC family protein [Deltaproteobacteria bacterium]
MLSIAASLFALPTSSDAQPLSSFLRAAITHSPDQRESEAITRQRTEERLQALGRLLPSLSARAGYTRNQVQVSVTLPPETGSTTTRQAIITPYDQVELSVTLDVPVLDLGALARLDAARMSEEGAQDRARGSRDELRRSVTRSYFQWVGAAALQRASERALVVSTQSVERLRARLSAGSATQLDVLRAEAEQARAQQSVAESMLTTMSAARALASSTGITPAAQPPTLDVSLDDVGELSQWEDGAQQSPAIRAAEADVRVANAQSRAAWMALAPTLNATATERVTNAAGFGVPATFSAGVNLQWRLDVSAIAAARASSVARTVADERVRRAEITARDQVHSAWLSARVGIERARAARAQVLASEAAAAAARERLTSGTATELEVLQADRDALSANVSKIQTDADLAYARVALRIASSRLSASEGGTQ